MDASIETLVAIQNPATRGLVRRLPPGRLDLVGDVHGQIDAMKELLKHLNYDDDGSHPHGRKLIFLGDLVDRGPDSAGVAEWVMRMVKTGAAHSILGNHELNILVNKAADHNAWFFGSEQPDLNAHAVSEERRETLRAFMKSLPLAMEREDLRVVHAAWHKPAIEKIRNEVDAVAVHDLHKSRILAELDRAGTKFKADRDLALQNDNPIKIITSGPEAKSDEPFIANGKERELMRVAWWNDYHDEAFSVFGHYWRNAPDDFHKGINLFEGYEAHHILGAGAAISIDYSVGARGISKGITRLAALRWPERELVFDDGDKRAIETRN